MPRKLTYVNKEFSGDVSCGEKHELCVAEIVDGVADSGVMFQLYPGELALWEWNDATEYALFQPFAETRVRCEVWPGCKVGDHMGQLSFFKRSTTCIPSAQQQGVDAKATTEFVNDLQAFAINMIKDAFLVHK